jgi:hypothetical protein
MKNLSSSGVFVNHPLKPIYGIIGVVYDGLLLDVSHPTN